MHSLGQFLPLLIVVALIYLFLRILRAPLTSAAPALARPPVRAFRNPANNYVEPIGTPWLWCLLFGCIYFAVRGVWTHAVGAALLAIFTAGISWLIYPLFARQIVETHYLRRGWQAV
jgi:hypothetical protein